VAVRNRTRCPARHTRIASAIARCLAGAGWAEEDHVLLAVEEVELAEMLDDLFFD
jgi:hypothetical protein